MTATRAQQEGIVDWMPEAREIAAQCWCDPDTAGKEMDYQLAEAVAKRIARWMETGAQHARNEEYWRDRCTRTETERNRTIEECAQALEPANHPLLLGAQKAIRVLKDHFAASGNPMPQNAAPQELRSTMASPVSDSPTPAVAAPKPITEIAHTDHPSRHWDRTCPACIAEGETPRTDARAESLRTTESWPVMYVDADFARQLERELAEWQKKAAAAVTVWHEKIHECDDLKAQLAARSSSELTEDSCGPAAVAAYKALTEAGTTISNGHMLRLIRAIHDALPSPRSTSAASSSAPTGETAWGPERQDRPGGPIYRVGASTGTTLPEQPRDARSTLGNSGTILDQLCKALGWQGGTIHEAIKEVSALRDSYRIARETFEEECSDGDVICEAAGVQRTEGGRLPVAKIVNAIRESRSANRGSR